MTERFPDMRAAADEAAEAAIVRRRDLHRHPELGLTEFRTASLAARRLAELGFDVHVGREVMDSESRVGLPPEEELARAYARAREEGAAEEYLEALAGGYTAVMGVLKGREPGPTVALRVDVDALPIVEDASEEHRPSRDGFASEHAGVMHACGHDCHTAIGLAVAELLGVYRDELAGTVKLLFQPAEEGGRGAYPMVQAGVVDDVDDFIAIHIGTGVPSGVLRPRVDGHLASVKLDARFRGRASHAGGRPEEGRNALLAAAQAVQGLYAISRHHAGRSRVNVGVLQGGAGRNVIADSASMMAEVRGETDEIAQYMLQRAEAVLRGAALAQDVEVEIAVAGRTSTARSDPGLARLVAEASEGVPGLTVDAEPFGASGSEDATYLMRRVQERGGRAIYAVVGSDLASGHHTPRFDIEEADFRPAIEALTRSILHLGRQPAAAGGS